MANLVQSVLALMVLVPATLAFFSRGGATNDDGRGPDSICNGNQCPDFRVVETVPGKYQKRVYAPAKWVSTTVMGLTRDDAAGDGFMTLFGYIQGQNVEKQKVEMTAPVTVRIIPGQGPACETTFTVSFFVPYEYQEEGSPPPTPTNENVTIVDLPEFTVYVSMFGGRAHDDEWISHETELGETLTELGLAFEDSFYYTAGYDSPFRLWNRHNEVWLVADDSTDSADTNVIDS